MPRQKIIVANWKMNGSTEFVRQWVGQFKPNGNATVVICPPFPYIALLRQLLDESILVGGQDVSAVPTAAARTGEVSAAMLADLGCRYAIVGHSEKRQHGGDDDATCGEKCRAVLASGLSPIYCLGEPASVRVAGQAESYVVAQLQAVLSQLKSGDAQKLHLAYEPIWAIGSGQTPSAAEITQTHAAIRTALIRQIGAVGDRIPLLYGGSVKSANAQPILNLANVDGLLVGGASLLPNEFNTICER